MEAIDFVKAIREIVVEDGLQSYRDLLDNTETASDITWKNILPIYNKLTAEEKESFLMFIRLVEVDTTSSLFGILDGSSYLSDDAENFQLNVESTGEQINGDLQDLFLEMEEDN